MAVDFPLSPGIITAETDNSVRQTVVPLGSVGALAGRFTWGPAMVPTLVADEAEYVAQFGEPENGADFANYIEWFNGKNFLEYGDSLNVVRVVNEDSAKNACFSGIDSVLIKNDDDYMDNLIIEEGGLSDGTGGSITIGQTAVPGAWIARYPGARGNTLRVDTCFATDYGRTISRFDQEYANTAGSIANTQAMVAATLMVEPWAGYANTTINLITFDPVAGSAGGREYEVQLNFNHLSVNTAINIWGGVSDYFEDSGDVLASTGEEKVVTFVAGGAEYNMLITNIDSANKKFRAYVNVGATGAPPAVLNLGSAGLEELTVKTRSKYKEFSYDAKKNSPNSLFGKVYFTNGATQISGKGTAFKKQVSKNDVLTIAGQKVSVSSVDSDVSLTVARPLVGEYDADTAIGWSREWEYAENFAGEPATSNHIRIANNDLTKHHNDQLHVVIIDDGKVIERYAYLSLAKDGKDDYNVPTYYVDRVNNGSEWVRWANHALVGFDHNWGSDTKIESVATVFTTYNKITTTQANGAEENLSVASFGGGSNGSTVTNNDLIAAFELFRSKEVYDIDFFITGWTYSVLAPLNYHLLISKQIQIAEDRKDCVVCVSGEYGAICRGKSDATEITENFVDWREAITLDSSYAIMDGNFKKQYDAYNNTYHWLPLSGDIAGIMAQTDQNQAPWYSPAGMNRGQIKNVVKLAYAPSQTNRDELYENQINPVLSFRGEGDVLYGDKTMTRIPSAFDRINVRRLFIRVKDFVVVEARKKLFEFNTPATRAEFARLISNYLDQVRTDQGLSDFRVVCDETNNTNQLIEENKFAADIYIKPTYVINFIRLNFTAVGQTVEFADLGL